MAFNQSTRNCLQKFVAGVRYVLTKEFTRQMQNDYGLDPRNGTIAALDELRIYTTRNAKPPTFCAKRSSITLRSRRTRRRRICSDAFCASRRLPFCTGWRRCGWQKRGFLIESRANGFSLKGFQLYICVAKTGLGETGDVYRTYLFSLFDEFALDLKVLFDLFCRSADFSRAKKRCSICSR